MLNVYLQLVVEGDELYTKVGKNAPPDESLGWTVVLMDRAIRFLWELRCSQKNRKLFKKALGTLEKLVNQTQDLSLITAGERRYGNILFEICHEVIRNGNRGRPRKTLKKGVKVRVKNKGSQAHKRGSKRPKYQTPCSEHPKTSQNLCDKDVHVNHCEAFNSSFVVETPRPILMRKMKTVFRELLMCIGLYIILCVPISLQKKFRLLP